MVEKNIENSNHDKIIIRGARVHNLKNIDVEIPKNKFVVITGLSGSGKSSLAFDTIFAEGQRRYVESLSSYAKQFLGNIEKPDVDIIKGLSPAISIDQRSASNNPRSTVGTVTEIYDYLRILFARVGRPHCPNCGKEITKQTPNQIVEQIISKYSNPIKIEILAPIIRTKKGEHRYALVGAKKAKFTKVRIDKVVMDIDEALDLKLDKKAAHDIDILVGEAICSSKMSNKEINDLYKLIQKGLELSGGFVTLLDVDGNESIYSKLYSCPDCGISIAEVTPSSFSFNNPAGACPTCGGLGIVEEADPNAVFPNARLTLAEGAIRPWTRITSQHSWHTKILVRLAGIYNFDLDTPVEDLPDDVLKIILYGELQVAEEVEDKDRFIGVIPDLQKRYKDTDSDYIRNEIAKYLTKKVCPSCNGQRLRKEVLAITVAGKNIVDIAKLSIEKCLDFFKVLNEGLTKAENQIASQLLSEINLRLQFLSEVGVSYLTLDRNAATLAGGEAQRIRLATQLGSQLTGVVYILDEPSIGLHQRDNEKLLETLKMLRDLGNTVIVVEHDEETIRSADYIFDIGPGAGDYGGEVVAQGTLSELMLNPNSITGKYLSGEKELAVPKKRRPLSGKFINILGAKEFNLKNIDAKIPLNQLVVVSGVSGSGKSTLVFDILAKALAQKLHRTKAEPGAHKKIEGIENIDKIINIDQSPIGRTPRSNPATFVGFFTQIRELFAEIPESRMHNYDSGQFSFNVRGGRCENCHGDGSIRIEMNFLPDVYITCEECKGKRYNDETLAIKYKGKTIADVLEMTVDESRVFFSDQPQIKQKLDILDAVGLGYLHLGQPATTLSGGEAQRIKLATELSRPSTGNTLYILDEPTTGLHFEDIKRLLAVLNQLVDKGNSVLVIEHNLDIIKSADWVLDLGPEGGDGGGEIVAQGTPEDIAKVKTSETGRYLEPILKKNLIGG